MENYILCRNKLYQVLKSCKADNYFNIIRNNAKNLKIAWNVINESLGKTQSNYELPLNIDPNKMNEFLFHISQMQLIPYCLKFIKIL